MKLKFRKRIDPWFGSVKSLFGPARLSTKKGRSSKIFPRGENGANNCDRYHENMIDKNSNFGLKIKYLCILIKPCVTQACQKGWIINVIYNHPLITRRPNEAKDLIVNSCIGIVRGASGFCPVGTTGQPKGNRGQLLPQQLCKA